MNQIMLEIYGVSNLFSQILVKAYDANPMLTNPDAFSTGMEPLLIKLRI